MANVKLKSIFTKEDIYTVLQLLKALADGVDENDTNMQAQIDELKQKIATLKPEPEGYAVDDAGNVTIAGALTANNNGDVEVAKNLNVDGNATFAGKNCFVWNGTVTDTIEGMSIATTLSGLFFHGSVFSVEGQTSGDPGIFALIAVNDDGLNFYFAKPVHYDPATQEPRPATVEEILSGNWSPYLSIEGGIKVLTDRSDGRLTTLSVNKLEGSENEPSISWVFKVEGENISLGEIARAAKKVKYQHTVHITALSDADKQLNVSFTAMSSDNTPVNSYQNLHTVFGGRNLTVSGNAKYYSMQLPVYLDLHGGSIGTDKIYCSSAESVGAYQQPTLDSFPNITFTDDVCIPK